MPTLRIAEHELSYRATLTHVPMGLLADPRAAAAGLYNALSPLNVVPRDVTLKGEMDGSLDVEVHVRLRQGERYELSHDEVHWEEEDPDLADHAELLRHVLAANEWVRTEQETGMRDHRLAYSAHYYLDTDRPEQVLARLGAPSLAVLGTSQGTGLVYNAIESRHGWTVELTVDRSLVYEGGLFVELEVEAADDPVDLVKMLGSFFELYHRAYAALGFTVEGG